VEHVHERTREITDDLVELLIATVHRIDARAHKKFTEELVNAFQPRRTVLGVGPRIVPHNGPCGSRTRTP
jgi:hypothetical protein